MSAPAIGPKEVFKEVWGTVSGKAGIILIAIIVCLAIFVPFYAPYNVVKAWSSAEHWVDYPPCAAPEWVQHFTSKKLPKTVIATDEQFQKVSIPYRVGGQVIGKELKAFYRFYYDCDEFPNSLKGFTLYVWPKTNTSINLRIWWMRPDGEKIKLADVTGVSSKKPYVLYSIMLRDVAASFVRECGYEVISDVPQVILFAQKGPEMSDPAKAKVLKGYYTLEVDMALTSDMDQDLTLKFVLFGRIYGLAGTDNKGRDLLIGLLWGAPIAIAFGLAGAVSIILFQTIFGVISGYFGGMTDEIIQRITEIYMIFPFLPTLILVSFLYRGLMNIWLILGLVIVLSLLGGMTKTVRSMIPSIREEQYIMAARCYGASNWRIILRYIFPRVLPYTFASIALSVPGMVFLEAGLAILNLSDPRLPTWGKILSDAEAASAAYYGYWWWIIEPAACIAITAVGFALLGYAFDKIVNPTLREM